MPFIFLSLYCIYHIVSFNIQSGGNNRLHEINLVICIVAYLFVLIQPLITDTIISNPPEKEEVLAGIFIIFYAFPFVYIIWNLIYIFKLNPSFYFISVILIFAYEIFYLYQRYIYEDTYVSEIKRYLKLKSKKAQLEAKLTNRIRNREDKLKQYKYDVTTINSLNKRLKKLKRKLTTKNRPQKYMWHPILFCRYRKNRKRIIKEVKRIIKENTHV